MSVKYNNMSRLRQKKALARKSANERHKLFLMHQQNLVSQWAKERLRDKIHLDASSFETDRLKLVNHEKAMQFLGKTRSKQLLAYNRYGSGELTEDQILELQCESNR